jgi:hypothetical protein
LGRNKTFNISSLETIKKLKIKQSKGAKKKAKTELSEIDKAEMDATEAFTFYLNRTASVEILTNFELLKVYFTIPNA